MTNKEFENYLALVSRLLRLKRGQREQIAVELRDHLELRVDELTKTGVDPELATRQALEEFGDAASLAGQFQFITDTYQRRWMMRFATLSVAGLFLTAVLVMAMWPAKARFGAPDSVVAKGVEVNPTTFDDSSLSVNTQRNMAIRKQLTEPSFFDEEETPFLQILERITEQYQINVLLDQSARDDSLHVDTPITFRVNGVPLNKALRLMLSEHNADFVVSDGVLRIISQDVASDLDYFSRKIFDVSELLSQIATLESHRIGTIKRTYLPNTGGGGFGGGGGGGGIFCLPVQVDDPTTSNADHSQAADLSTGGPSANSAPKTKQASSGGGLGGGGFGGGSYVETEWTAEEMLSDLVRRTIAPDSWADENGDGTLEILGGLMIVNQSEFVNERISEFLQDLNYRFSVRINNDTSE